MQRLGSWLAPSILTSPKPSTLKRKASIMAILLEANYSKKLGLPGYSSHQYSVTVKTEVTDPNLVQTESNRLYELLQSCVDSQIQKTGFLPDGSRSTSVPIAHGNGKDASNAKDVWACSPKQ